MAKMILAGSGYQVVDDNGKALSDSGLGKTEALAALCKANSGEVSVSADVHPEVKKAKKK